MHTLKTLKKPLTLYTEKAYLYHEKLWDSRQDGESDSGHIRGLCVRSCGRECDI